MSMTAPRIHVTSQQKTTSVVQSGKFVEYLIKVDILSVQSLSWGSLKQSKGEGDNLPDPFIQVKLNDNYKETAHYENTASASFNYFFTFTERLRDIEFGMASVDVIVLHRAFLGIGSEFIGKATFGLRKIYACPRHWVCKEWFPLMDPENPADSRGSIRLSLGVFGPGDEIPTHNTLSEEGKESRNTMRNRIISAPLIKQNLYILSIAIHKGDLIMPVGDQKESNPYVKIHFSGISKQTRVQANVSAPMWGEVAKIPCQYPCWHSVILVELWHELKDGHLHIGTVHLDFDRICEESLPPTWCNFYTAPLNWNIFGFRKLEQEPNIFAGRVLITGTLERAVTNPIASMSACTEFVCDPKTEEHVLRVDLYEVCFEMEHPPDEVRAVVTFGMQAAKSEIAKIKDGTFIWEEEHGRIDEISVFVPTDHMCFDLIINFETKKGWLSDFEPYMFTKICTSDFRGNWNSPPSWRDSRSLTDQERQRNAGYCLVQISSGPKAVAPQRPARVEYKLRPYVVRAFLYQCTNLPISDPEALSDPFVKVTIGSGIGFTSVMKQCLQPTWYEALEFQVILPNNESLRPDITVEVLHQGFMTTDCLGTFRYPTNWKDAVPKEWPWLPEWFDLEPPEDNPWARGQVLASFEMVPRKQVTEYPFFSNIRPQEHRCTVELFVVGLRLTEASLSEICPVLEVACGRQEEDLSQPRKVKNTQPGTGAGGQFNFLERVELGVKLPMDPHFQQWLEIRLLDSRDGGLFGQSSLAFAYIHLNPYIGWIDFSEQEKWRQQFKTKPKEQLIEEKAQEQEASSKKAVSGATGGESPDAGRTSIKSLVSSNNEDGQRDLDREEIKIEVGLSKRFGLNPTEISKMNNRPCEILEFSNLLREAGEGEDADDLELLGEPDTRESPQKGITKTRSFLQSIMGPNKDSEESARNIAESNQVCGDFDKRFKWNTGSADIANERPELPHGFERELPFSNLPYDSVPVIKGSVYGEKSIRKLGTLKFCCRVELKQEKKKDGPDAADEAWEKTIARLQEDYQQAQDLVFRCYILTADALIPASGAGDTSTYIWIKNAETPLGTPHNLQDTGNIRKKTLMPEFNKCYILDHCGMPENATLRISIMENMLLGDQEIGMTTIDVEDRWFHPKYREMIRSKDSFKAIPIELRPIRNANSSIPQGTVSVWVEFMTAMQANAHPIQTLQSPDADPYQLRIVIWRTKDVTPGKEEESTHQQVHGTMKMDEQGLVYQETDIHYGSTDERATFNWRFIFDVLIPCQDASIKLQVLNSSALGSSFSDVLGEVSLDLMSDFMEARRSKTSLEVPKGWIQVYHPFHPGMLRGQVELELKLVPGDEATQYPVGAGRDEPNKDPFLDPDDPHITDHRNYFANTEIAQAIGNTVESVQQGFAYLMYMQVFAAVVAGIVMLVIFIKVI